MTLLRRWLIRLHLAALLDRAEEGQTSLLYEQMGKILRIDE